MVLVAVSFFVSLTLPNLEQLDQPGNGRCCSCLSACCADEAGIDDAGGGRQLGEIASGVDVGGSEGRSRRDYTKRLASERESDYRKSLLGSD